MPADASIEVRGAVRLYVVLKYSLKLVMTGAFTVENPPLTVEMLRSVREDYGEKPFAIFARPTASTPRPTASAL